MIKDTLLSIKNLSKLGTKISEGTYTSVYIPIKSLKTNIKKPVIVLTEENNKILFLKKLFENSKIEIEDLNNDNIDKELLKELKEKNITPYIMTKLNKIDFKKLEIFEILEDTLYSEKYLKSFTKRNFDINDFLNDIRKEFKSKRLDISPFENKIINSIEHSLQSIKSSKIKGKINLDIHEEQFASLEDEIYCIDPVIFEF